MSKSILIKIIDGYNGEELSRLFSTVIPREGEIIHLQNIPVYDYHVRCVRYLISNVDEMITYVEVLVTV